MTTTPGEAGAGAQAGAPRRNGPSATAAAVAGTAPERKGETAPWTPVDEVARVVARARAAFAAWSQVPVRERAACVARLRRYIVRHRDELAGIISADTGKPLVEALAHDLLTTAEALKFMERQAPRVLRPRRERTSLLFLGKGAYVERKPYGCVLVIAPWNYPFNLAVVPAATALLAGNTVVLKPSEVTPAVSRAIEEAFGMAGFPPGVIQVVHGGPEVGQAAVDARPDFIFFTGSTATGRKIATAAAGQLTPTLLELGGKDPMIVLPDADVPRAARAAVWGALANCGQTCIGIERIYVHEDVKDRFIDRVLHELRSLRTAWSPAEPGGPAAPGHERGGRPAGGRAGAGAPAGPHGVATGAAAALDPDLDVGLMTTRRQVEIVREHVEDALARGARLLTPVPGFSGRAVPPIVLVDVDQDAKVMQEETFGPVIAIRGFRSLDEAVRLANDSRFGLGASVWTADRRLARRLASRLQAGGVCINDVILHFAHPGLPFGGVKESGWGAYHGRAGLEAFTYPSAVLVEPGRLPGKLVSSLLWYPYRGKYRLFSLLMRMFCG